MSTFKTFLTDDLNVASRPAAALADHYETAATV